jgi:hypothetical protein
MQGDIEVNLVREQPVIGKLRLDRRAEVSALRCPVSIGDGWKFEAMLPLSEHRIEAGIGALPLQSQLLVKRHVVGQNILRYREHQSGFGPPRGHHAAIPRRTSSIPRSWPSRTTVATVRA